MIRAIDHVVILVTDLEQAAADYRALGFNVVNGGEHTGGASANVLVSFADGCYLELIAFRRSAPDHIWWRHVAAGEGLIDFALLPTTIAEDLEQARGRGLPLEGPFPGGRQRPDGVQLEWQTGRATTPDLPFFCADVTPRSLRVPHGEAHRHPNGATGIAALSIAVQDLAASSAHYQALLGMQRATSAALVAPIAFALSDTQILLSQDAAANQRIALRGEGPCAIEIRVATGAATGTLDLTTTHGVRMSLR